MSFRHLAYLSKSKFVNLRDIVFLVKDPSTGLHFTQFHKTTSKPIKAYYHGLDITTFLTHRPNLTAYSYYFINYAYAIGFNILDVRAYFNGFSRVTKLEPDVRKLQSRGCTGYKRRVTAQAQCSQSLADASASPLEISTPGYSILQKMRDNRIPPPLLAKKVDTSYFNDSRIFRTAWRLCCSNIATFKFAETRFELYQTLRQAGLKDDMFVVFKQYLTELLGDITTKKLMSMCHDMAKQFGWFAPGSHSLEKMETVFTYSSLAMLGIQEKDLLTKAFPECFHVN